MGKLTEWVKANAKDGANIAEFEELEGKMTFEGITTKEQAADFIKKNAAFTSAVDMMTTKAVQTHDEKFQAEKLPELEKTIRDKITAELNPEKTPDQKRIEELEKYQQEAEAEKKRQKVADGLVAKAKEIGYKDPEVARRYVAYGDKAEIFLQSDFDERKASVDAAVEAKIKELYGNQEPPKRPHTNPGRTMSRMEFDALPPTEKMAFAAEVKNGNGNITD